MCFKFHRLLSLFCTWKLRLNDHFVAKDWLLFLHTQKIITFLSLMLILIVGGGASVHPTSYACYGEQEPQFFEFFMLND